MLSFALPAVQGIDSAVLTNMSVFNDYMYRWKSKGEKVCSCRDAKWVYYPMTLFAQR